MADITSNLVGLWDFSNNGNDTSGSANVHNVTVNGATYITDKDGNALSALSFDGVNDYAQGVVDSDLQLPAGQDMTISTWLNWSTGNDIRAFIQVDPHSGVGTRGWQMYVTSSGQPQINLRRDSVNPVKTFSDALTNNTWHHVAMVIDRNVSHDVKYYLDGVYKDSLDISAYTAVDFSSFGDHPFYFGGFQSLGLYSLGKIDKYSLYQRALSAADVAELYSPVTLGFSKINGISEASIAGVNAVAIASISKVNNI